MVYFWGVTSLFSQQCSSFHTVFPSYEDNNSASAMSCNVDTTISDFPCNTESLMTLWHSRLCHPNRLVLNKVLPTLNINVSSYAVVKFCDACQYGKLHQASFPPTLLLTTTP